MSTPDEQRICLTVQYDGSAFFGWQLQREERTVQGELERVLGRLLARPVRVTGSGRTDRGVHALGQVATVDVPGRWTAESLSRALNALLPAEIRVWDARVVPSHFHPRFGAVSRGYVYRIGTQAAARSPFRARWCWPVRETLDPERLSAASAALVGDHSFAAFAKAGQEERGDRCTVHSAEWLDWAELGVEFRISANRFLHHMVRYLVGTLVEIGAGRREPGEVSAMLQGAPGLETSPPAPPEGLYLRSVRYPLDAWGELGPPPEAPEAALP